MIRHVTLTQIVMHELILSLTQAAQTTRGPLNKVLTSRATYFYRTRTASKQQATEHIWLTAKHPKKVLQPVLLTTRANQRVTVQTSRSTLMSIRFKSWIEAKIKQPKKVNYMKISSHSSKIIANLLAKKRMASSSQGLTSSKTKTLTSLRLFLRWKYK